jgi:hypothetical protein
MEETEVKEERRERSKTNKGDPEEGRRKKEILKTRK